jgi:hypothetical protein
MRVEQVEHVFVPRARHTPKTCTKGTPATKKDAPETARLVLTARLGRLLRVLIDLALGELRKRLVGLLFLTKRRLEKLN